METDRRAARAPGVFRLQPPAAMADPSTSTPSLARPIPGLPLNVGSTERIVSTGLGAALVGASTQAEGGLRAALAVVGAVLAARGATGYCPAYGALGASTANPSMLTVDSTVTVNRPRAEVFAAWTGFDALAASMEHVESIERLGNRRSRWTAKGPFGKGTVSWVAEETERVEGRETAFRTVEGDLDHAGRVTFEDTLDGTGTVVRVHWRYVVPLGAALLAEFTSPAFETMLRGDLYRFRALLEAGEVPTTDGQPKGPWRPGMPVISPTSPD